MNWMDVEEYLKRDKRIVLVLGATEEHGDLSLCTDTLIPFSIAEKSCDQEQVILAPTVNFGISTWSKEYPGTITLNTTTYVKLIEDIMNSLLYSGFRKFVVLNGHGFNRSVSPVFGECIQNYQDAEVKMLQWYDMQALRKKEEEIGEKANHANWAENFSYTNISQGKRIIEYNENFVPNLLQSNGEIRRQMGLGVGHGLMAVDLQEMSRLEEQLVEEFSLILKNVK